MARVKDLIEGIGELPAWAALGGAAALVLLLGGSDLRRLGRRAVRGYLATRDTARAWTAEAAEDWQDLCAEAEAEYRAEVEERGPASGPREEVPLGLR